MSLLREIGVDWYVPRQSLASEPCALAKVQISPVALVKENKPSTLTVDVAGKQAQRKHMPNIDFGLDQSTPKFATNVISVEAKKARSASPAKVSIESFDLLVASGESIVFVCDVKTNPLNAVWERSVKQFFSEIQQSLCQQINVNLSLDYFSWPVRGTKNISLGEQQLMQLLFGFMGHRITDDKKAIILFGDNAKRHASSMVSSESSIVVISASGLGEMFTKFSAKAALWRDLQNIIQARV
jgi:hypothetical protein